MNFLEKNQKISFNFKKFLEKFKIHNDTNLTYNTKKYI